MRGSAQRHLGHRLALATIGVAAVFACKGSDSGTSSDSGTATTDTATDTASTTSGTVVINVPVDLASAASPFNLETAAEATAGAEAATQASGTIVLGLTQTPPPPPPGSPTGPYAPGTPPPPRPSFQPKGPLTRKAFVVHQLVAAEGTEDCLYEYVPEPEYDASCYGPTLGVTNHPDGTTSQALPRGDVGLWSATNGDKQEACVAAKVNQLTDVFGGYVQRITGLSSMMHCLARVKNAERPETEEADVDWKTQLKDYIPSVSTAFPFDIKQAVFRRLPNDAAGNPVYLTHLVFEDRSRPNVREIDAYLRYEPGADGDGEYKGKLWLTSERADLQLTQIQQPQPGGQQPPPGGQQPPPGGQQPVQPAPGGQTGGCNGGVSNDGSNVLVTSIDYVKSGDAITYEVRTAGRAPTATDFFDSDQHPKYESNGSNCGAEYAVMRMDTERGTGDFAYAWVAGSNAERTRSFVASVTETGDGSDQRKVGVGYYGFGPSMTDLITARAAVTAGTAESARRMPFIEGMICNWAGPNGFISQPDNLKDTVIKDLVQMQTAEQDADGYYTQNIVNHIAYSPQNACQAGPNSTFMTQVLADNNQPIAGVGKVAAVATHELLAIGAGSGEVSVETLKSVPVVAE